MSQPKAPDAAVLSRRDMLRRSAVLGGALAVAAPAVQSFARPAFASTGDAGPSYCGVVMFVKKWFWSGKWWLYKGGYYKAFKFESGAFADPNPDQGGDCASKSYVQQWESYPRTPSWVEQAIQASSGGDTCSFALHNRFFWGGGPYVLEFMFLRGFAKKGNPNSPVFDTDCSTLQSASSKSSISITFDGYSSARSMQSLGSQARSGNPYDNDQLTPEEEAALEEFKDRFEEEGEPTVDDEPTSEAEPEPEAEPGSDAESELQAEAEPEADPEPAVDDVTGREANETFESTAPTAPPWREGESLSVGDQRTYSGSVYEARAAHTATADTSPLQSPDLWSRR